MSPRKDAARTASEQFFLDLLVIVISSGLGILVGFVIATHYL